MLLADQPAVNVVFSGYTNRTKHALTAQGVFCGGDLLSISLIIYRYTISTH